jgi:hypothetical protein
MPTWTKPSFAGRRLALQRKYELNVDHYGGGVGVLTITAPGAELLPWDVDRCVVVGPHRCDGRAGCKVEWIYAHVWNATAQARMSRLWEAATRAADRWIERQWGVKLKPVQVGNVRVPQQRGVHHFHYATPQKTEMERVWSRLVRKYVEAARRRELAEFSPEQRWSAIELEYRTGQVTRGVYGFGFNHPGRSGQTSEKAARYMARNAAGYLSANALGGGRHYLSSRLTRETGVTMAALRSCNYLYVRRKLGEDAIVPLWWSDEKRASVLSVWALVEARRRGP